MRAVYHGPGSTCSPVFRWNTWERLWRHRKHPMAGKNLVSCRNVPTARHVNMASSSIQKIRCQVRKKYLQNGVVYLNRKGRILNHDFIGIYIDHYSFYFFYRGINGYRWNRKGMMMRQIVCQTAWHIFQALIRMLELSIEMLKKTIE